MSRGQLIKEGIETVFDNIGTFLKTAKSPYAKNRRISKIAAERGYRRAGSGSQEFYPEELLYLDKKRKGGPRWKLKDPNFGKKNNLIVKLDEDGIPISHTITARGVDKYGRIARRDEGGKIIGYVKPETFESGARGTGNYKRSEKDLEQVKKLRDMIAQSRIQQEKITDGYINEFFIQNPDLADISKIDNNVLAQLQDFIPPYEMGTSKGKKIKIATIKKKLNEKGLFEFRPRFVPDETKELVKNYLLDNDKWKTISTPQVIEDLNLQGQISPSTLGKLRRTGFGTNKNLSPIGKDRTSLDKARRDFNRMVSLKYGGDPKSPVRNRLAQAFADYMGDAFGVGRKQGYTPEQIQEGFRFVEDTELAFNTLEGQAYQEMFENLQAINKRKLAEINGERAAQGLDPVGFFDKEVEDVMLTMGHARLNAGTGKVGAFDLSKIEPETMAKNKLALKLGIELKNAIKKDDLRAVDRVVTEMINNNIRHEVILPGRKFKGTGELEGLETTIDDTFIIGGEAPEPFPLEPLADGGMVGENVLEEPMVDEETGMLDYLSDKKKQFEDFTGITKMDEALQDYVEEDLGGNPFRAVPVAISKILKIPGAIRDFYVDNQNKVNQTLEENAILQEQEGNTEVADQMRSLKSGDGILGSYNNPITIGGGFLDLMTSPLQEGYENMFTDDDHFYNPFTGEKFMADTAFKKGIAAGATVGLTAIEVMLAFNPIKIKAIGRMPPGKARAVLQVGADLLANAGAIIVPYETKESNIRDLFGITEEIRDQMDKAEEIQKEVIKGDQADPLNPGGPGINYADGGMIGLPPEFTGEYAETKLAMGGEPGQFSNPTPSGLEEEIDIGDYLLDAPYESVEDLDNLFDITRSAEDAFQRDSGFLDDQVVEVASRGDALKEGIKYVLGEVPNWVRQGKERIQKILPKTGQDLIDEIETRALSEGLTPITRSEPGQLFYSRLEAELMQGPKVYESLDAFKKYTQSRNIGKVELFDSELERIISSAQAAGRPITRELVLGALKESPLSKVQSKGYGFLSDAFDGKQRSLKYPGYKEDGALPGTDRERLLFVDPNDLRGDPGRLPSTVSPHSWEEPYTIAWSRLSDRDLGGAYTGKTVTFADEIQSDIFQAAQKTAGKLAAKIKYMAENNVPLDTMKNELQRDMMTFFADKGSVYRESLPGAAELQVEMQALMDLQDQLTALKNTPVPEITDDMLDAAKNIRYQQNDIIDNMTEELNLQLVKTLYPNLPFKLRGQWADASIKRDIYEAAYRKFVLKDPNATDYYAVTPANLVTARYSHAGSSATSQAERAADKAERIKRWVDGGMEGELAPSRYPGIGMYEFYGGPGADVVTDTGKHYTSEIEKILKRIANENQVPLETLPVKISDYKREVFQVVDRTTGEVLGSGNTGRQADAIANDIIANSDRKVIVKRAEEFDTAPSFGIELTPSMAEAFKAYMAKGGLVEEEILLPYGD
jgi:hypothetical protein